MLTNSRDIKRRLESEGWRLDRVRGSHHTFKHPRLGTVTFQHPEKDMGKGIVWKIYKAAGWAKD